MNHEAVFAKRTGHAVLAATLKSWLWPF